MSPSSDHYARVISVAAPAPAVYRALTSGYDDWWTTTGGRRFDQIGDRIRFTFPPLVSYWTFEARVLTPGKRVELECVEAYHEMSEQPEAPTDEWLGSRLIFEIAARGETTDIRFTHEGLTRALACYGACEQGWDRFFVDSLAAYLNTGLGKPYS